MNASSESKSQFWANCATVVGVSFGLIGLAITYWQIQTNIHQYLNPDPLASVRVDVTWEKAASKIESEQADETERFYAWVRVNNDSPRSVLFHSVEFSAGETTIKWPLRPEDEIEGAAGSIYAKFSWQTGKGISPDKSENGAAVEIKVVIFYRGKKKTFEGKLEQENERVYLDDLDEE